MKTSYLNSFLFLIILTASILNIVDISLYAQHSNVFNIKQNINPEIQMDVSYTEATNDYELIIRSNTVSSVTKSNIVYKKILGDFNLYARCSFKGSNASGNCKIGFIIKNNLENDKPKVSAIINRKGTVSLNSADKDEKEILFKIDTADVFQIERRDSIYTLKVAKFGEPFVSQQVTLSQINDEAYVGLFVSSESCEQIGAVFKDVRVTIPVDPALALLRTNIGSTIEVLDIETGARSIVTKDTISMYSPIFSQDNNSIIYGKQGYLFKHNLRTNQYEVIGAGDKKFFNNDHVLSPDGKELALCIKEPDKGGAILYTLPITGGVPKQINFKGATYPHCWSPDGKDLLFSKATDGTFDIYKISLNNGEETRLTKSQGRDDCPEYSPDGEYIYFNSNRTGSMRIWRMKTDGSGEEPITNDDFHDWFPHISPDGKWIVFLSYNKDEVTSAANPYYKQIYLRIMPTSGGVPKVLAYLYGGNGSINSPCWSSDSKTITFASNSDITQ